MYSMRYSRFAHLLVIASIAALTAAGQLNKPLNDDGEPFSIRRGSTFSASGGAPARGRAAMDSDHQRSRILDELREVREIVSRNHVNGPSASSAEDYTRLAVSGMLRSLDPHSTFYGPSQWSVLLDEQRSGYSGIGAVISDFGVGGVLSTYVLSTFPNSPASGSQLRFGDRIVAVNGETMSGKSSEIIKDKIRGPIGSMFRLTVERSATRRIETLEIRRNRVPVPSIPDAYMIRQGIGYIDLSQGFTYTTAAEFEKAMTQLGRSGMRSLILDLRGNGGGVVDQAVKVAETFLPAGTLILTQRGRNHFDSRVWTSTNRAASQIPLVVLVNKQTASASEIVAGAFQDNDRALIVGEKTFGKGLVQSVLELPGKAGLTLTTARYLTPSSRSIQRDYSNGDLYDYFSHKTQAAAIGKPYFEARTRNNRKVVGGDGIAPDEVVRSETVSEIQASLLDPIFEFVRESVNGRMPGAQRSLTEIPLFGAGIGLDQREVSDEVVGSFYNFLTKTGTTRWSADVLKRETDFVRRRLQYTFAMALKGSVAAEQVLVGSDPQVAKGIEALPRAAQLARPSAYTRSDTRITR